MQHPSAGEGGEIEPFHFYVHPFPLPWESRKYDVGGGRVFKGRF